jgi:hypothetical protein
MQYLRYARRIGTRTCPLEQGKAGGSKASASAKARLVHQEQVTTGRTNA